jgi:hypothetical protein
MENMNSTAAPLVAAGTNNGISFKIGEVGVVCFGVSGLTSGSIKIQAQMSTGGTWEDLDTTNLVWSGVDGFAYAVIGAVSVRAVGTDATTGGTLFVGIAGRYVHAS